LQRISDQTKPTAWFHRHKLVAYDESLATHPTNQWRLA
jgi:hypothetical protein